jgi:hypothetical protein
MIVVNPIKLRIDHTKASYAAHSTLKLRVPTLPNIMFILFSVYLPCQISCSSSSQCTYLAKYHVHPLLGANGGGDGVAVVMGWKDLGCF